MYRSQVIEWIEQGIIPPGNIEDALHVSGVRPGGERWRSFIDRLLLWSGGLALAFSLLFFVAYNWKEMGNYFKFGMVQGFIALAVGAYWKWNHHKVAGKVSLLVATLGLGVLLALYGQIYQTGADPWQLFFNWALLMLPWALIGRFPAIWIVWVGLINISIMAYSLTFLRFFGIVFSSETGMVWALFVFNSLVFSLWELLTRKWSWLDERWAVRLLAVGSGAPLTWLVLVAIFDYPDEGGFAALVWLLWLGGMYSVYRRVKPDLFMLAGCCLSAITVIVSFMGKHLLDHGDAGGFLVLTFIVIGMGGGAALWLKHIHREFQS